MLKGYLIGLLSATLAVLLVAVIWFGTQPPQDEGFLWGGKVYTSRQEFDGYLKSKGLSYEPSSLGIPVPAVGAGRVHHRAGHGASIDKDA